MIAGYRDFKRSSTNVNRIYRGATLVWERINVFEADMSSVGYVDAATACNTDATTAITPIYSENGIITVGKKLYWDNQGYNSLTDAYYKTASDTVIQVVNSVVSNVNVNCTL
jgi:hypothetical protein